MAIISLNIPDPALPRVVDALCARGGWTADQGARGAFAKAVLADWLKQEVLHHERQVAREAAVAAVPEPDPVDVT